jgi:hypothetical protein
MRSETEDSSTAATGSPEAGFRAHSEDATAREAAAGPPAATEESISPELASIDPRIANLTAIREPRTRTGSRNRLSRAATHHFRWLALGLAVIAAGVLFPPTSRLLGISHLHIAGRRVDATIAAKRLAQSPGAARHSASGRTASDAAQTRLAPFRAHAFGWVRVPAASYYRIRFFRGGREVFEALPTRARIVLPAKWRFRGRNFGLAPGRYRWVVQAGFGVPSSKRYGKTVVAADWIAEPR